MTLAGLRRTAGIALVCLGWVLLLGACNNQYGPPVEGQPLTWGQQHYLDNQRYQQQNQQFRMERDRSGTGY